MPGRFCIWLWGCWDGAPRDGLVQCGGGVLEGGGGHRGFAQGTRGEELQVGSQVSGCHEAGLFLRQLVGKLAVLDQLCVDGSVS